MSRLFRILLIASLLVGLAPALPAAAQPALPSNCQLTPGPNSGELYLICWPQPPDPAWNGDLVVFAHGYVAPDPYGSLEDILKQLILPNGSTVTTLPALATGMGYAFAMTTYSKNGLAVKEGLADTLGLIQAFKWQYPQGRVYLVGASEGGLITTLAAEQSTLISGGLALCGPIGSFRGQIDYWGDFRVLFDYFYRQALPSSPVRIPPGVMVNWEHLYVPRIAGLIGNPDNQLTTLQLLNTSGAPIDPLNPSTAVDTTVGILSYNVFATNEAQDELGGQPFDNMSTVYVGSADDEALNAPRGAQRFAADPAALQEIGLYYETSGSLKVPLVTMHTSGDPIVPYWHEEIYNAKSPSGGSAPPHINIRINRYGHCTFTADEAMAGFAQLVLMVTSGP